MSRYSEEKYFEISVKPTKEALPLSDNAIGDRYIVGDDVYIWNGNFWVEANLLDPPASLFIQTYNVSAVSNVVDEGDTLTINLTTTNIPDNTTLGYTITGTVSSADLSGASLTGSFTIVDNTASVAYTVAEDLTTEGGETLIFSLDNGADSTSVTIGDTSTTPVAEYTLSRSQATVDEGDSFTITLNTVNVPTGTLLPYTITGIQATDLEAPGETSLTGSFTIDAVGASQKSFNIKEDSSVDEGSETFLLTLNNGGDNISVTINDTSAIVSGDQLFTENGTFTVPAGVTSVKIYAVGGGGSAEAGEFSNGSSGGGGGGAYVSVLGWPVTPGDAISVYVGAGGTAGINYANSPFEIVSTNSGTGLTYYPQSGSILDPTSGQASYIVHNTVTVATAGGGGIGRIITGGNGGVGSVHSSVATLADSHEIVNGKTGNVGQSGNSGTFPGGGGGAGRGGMGGRGRGDFYRSNGGYNYSKQANGGQGGGMHLYGGAVTGNNGTNAPPLYSGSYNYTLAGNGTNGGTATGNAYGGGAGGGVGGRIRNQTIISSGTSYYYKWFLGKDTSSGTQGAIRFAWGNS
jgi:hypothetical protein